MKVRYSALRGTCDILPDEVVRWQFLERTIREIFSRYGFREIRTPVIESTRLFARSVGESTDIIHKEMYTFRSGDESVSLRPENTASVVRAFVEHNLFRTVAAGYPERYYYIGPMFRHERPQKGRQRQFHQVGAEILGSLDPLADAETLEMLWRLLDRLGIRDRELVLNSLGDHSCQKRYRAELVDWLRPRAAGMCEDCKRRIEENPLRVFDCKVEEDRTLLEGAPSVLDFLNEESEGHFREIRSLLDSYGIAYRTDPRMVRGLDYYQRTVFEVVSTGLGAQNAILGGGRYDSLVEDLGGPSMPAFGFAVGMERLISLMPEDLVPPDRIDLAIVCLGREGWEGSVEMARKVRTAGRSVIMPLIDRPMGAQIKRAGRMGARFALFVGKDELAAGRFGLKNLATGEQTTVDESGLLARLGEDG
jgi:histidyl-tRNA synthetase